MSWEDSRAKRRAGPSGKKKRTSYGLNTTKKGGEEVVREEWKLVVVLNHKRQGLQRWGDWTERVREQKVQWLRMKTKKVEFSILLT